MCGLHPVWTAPRVDCTPCGLHPAKYALQFLAPRPHMHPMTDHSLLTHPPLADLIDDFAFLDSWEDRYMHVIDLGERSRAPHRFRALRRQQGAGLRLPGLACQRGRQGGIAATRLTFRGDSDAHIVRGLVAVVLAALSGRSKSDILATDMEDVMAKLGLSEHLSSQRANGLRSMVARIRAEAAA